MNIIEPCCAERQIGQLLREHRGHAVLFQTNGDVTLEKWMKAVMLLSGDRPRTLTLAVPVFTQKMMAAMAKYLQLEWVAHLRLMTTDPLPPETIAELSALIHPDAETSAEANSSLFTLHSSLKDTLHSSLSIAADPAIPSPLLMFSGSSATVVIQGPILDAVTPALCLYAGTIGGQNSLALRAMTDAWEARFRARRYEPTLAEPAPASAAATTPVQSVAVLGWA